MEWQLILVPLSLGVALLIGVFFSWAARKGQFDDLDSHGERILTDDDQCAPGGSPPGGTPST
jgi:cbb3-type cytochrome oxidase maturation protein